MVKRGGKEENPEEFLDPPTPFGEKKRISSQMAKQYSPTAVEKSYVLFFIFIFSCMKLIIIETFVMLLFNV